MFRSGKGPMPKRESIEVVVGHPIPCPKIAEPTLRQIDEYHALYLSSLKELYDTHRRLFHKLKRGGSHDDLHARMSKMKEIKFSRGLRDETNGLEGGDWRDDPPLRDVRVLLGVL